MEENKDIELTEKELAFCELFVDGDKEFAGQASACYTEVYGIVKHPHLAARRVMKKKHVAEHLKELLDSRCAETETIAIKLQVAETLKAVMAETAKGEYMDKFGVTVSPAPLRAVSVNAAKALMEIYPIKHNATEGSRSKDNSGNIIFNVIVPQNPPAHHEESED